MCATSLCGSLVNACRYTVFGHCSLFSAFLGRRSERREDWPHHRHRRDGRLPHLRRLVGQNENVQVRRTSKRESTLAAVLPQGVLCFGKKKTKGRAEQEIKIKRYL